MSESQIEAVERIQGELRSWRQVLRQTDEQVMAAQDGWESEDVSALRDTCRTNIARLEGELAEIDGREYVAPEKVGDADHVRVGDVEDALAELSEMASESDVTIADLLDAIADLSEDVSNLYAGEGGE